MLQSKMVIIVVIKHLIGNNLTPIGHRKCSHRFARDIIVRKLALAYHAVTLIKQTLGCPMLRRLVVLHLGIILIEWVKDWSLALLREDSIDEVLPA